MSRTLTAGVSAETRRTPRINPDASADVVAGLWISVARVYGIASRYQKRADALRQTRDLLGDPRYREHPGREAAEQRADKWRWELRQLDLEVTPTRRALARQWDMLPAHIIQFLRLEGGWPEAETGKDMAAGLWQQAIIGGAMPRGECPF
ncbi:MAG: hypothetical protein QM692_09280 [Thermomicrobiales bacterium]